MTVTMASISPSGREFPRGIPARRRALFLWCLSAPQRRLCLFSITSSALGFRDEEVREGVAVRGGCGPPPHKAARPGQGPRRPVRGAHGGPPRLLLLALGIFSKNKIFHITFVNCWSFAIMHSDNAFSSRILPPVRDLQIIMKHAK